MSKKSNARSRLKYTACAPGRTPPDKGVHGLPVPRFLAPWFQTLPLASVLFKRRQYNQEAIEELQESNRLIQKKYEETRRLAAELDQANQQLVAQQKQMEAQAKALIASERQYRVLADNVTDVIWILDLATLKFDYISPSVERSRGFTQEEAKALSLEETVSKDVVG